MISNIFGDEKNPTKNEKPEDKKSENDKNPFKHFEIKINGNKVSDPKEIKKEEDLFENMFDGFDFDFNPLNVFKDIHEMNNNFQSNLKIPDFEKNSKYLNNSG